MQLNADVEDVHEKAIEAFRSSKNRYQIIYSENTEAEPTSRYAWRCAMGGLMPMMLEMDVASTPVEELKRCRYLQQFFEGTPFHDMEPHDELAQNGTKWVLADPGKNYIAYAEELDGLMGIVTLTKGTYSLEWIDCGTGKTIKESVEISNNTEGFTRPISIGKWCAVWINHMLE